MHNLCKIIGADLEFMLQWRNDPSVRENMYSQKIIEKEQHFLWWEDQVKGGDLIYLMYEKNGIPSGVISFTDINIYHENATWAFYADPNAPRGCGAWMELLALDYAFNKLKLKNLFCKILSYNNAVIKMHKKFSFVEKGVFKAHFKYRRTFVDIVRLAHLGFLWEKTRPVMIKKIQRM